MLFRIKIQTLMLMDEPPWKYSRRIKISFPVLAFPPSCHQFSSLRRDGDGSDSKEAKSWWEAPAC